MSDQFDLGSMLSQAMAMQQQFEQARADAAAREFVGQAGGGAVAIRITGGMQVLNVSISPEAVDPSDVAMLEDLVLAAFHATGSARAISERSHARPRRPRWSCRSRGPWSFRSTRGHHRN